MIDIQSDNVMLSLIRQSRFASRFARLPKTRKRQFITALREGDAIDWGNRDKIFNKKANTIWRKVRKGARMKKRV